MERMIRAFENFSRAVKIHNALPRSQKEREQHRYDQARKVFEEEFDSAVSNIIRKRISEIEAGIEKRFAELGTIKEPKESVKTPDVIDSAVKATVKKNKK